MKPDGNLKKMTIDIIEDISDEDQRDGDLFSSQINSSIKSTSRSIESQK
jgi:hypothetical protein